MNRSRRDGRNSILIGTFLFILSFTTYVLTLCPTVSWYDSGELISACFNLGIAHPTGYPLYTIIGRIFSLLPLGNSAFRVNIMSAFLGAMTVIVIYVIMRTLLVSVWKDAVQKRRDRESLRFFKNEVPAVVASLTFAFSPLFWTQAIIAEVYTLHTTLIALLIFSLLRLSKSLSTSSHSTEDTNCPEGDIFEKRRMHRYQFLFLFCFLLGLSLGHHLTTLLYIPAFLFFIAAEDIRLLKNVKIITIAFLFFLLGL